MNSTTPAQLTLLFVSILVGVSLVRGNRGRLLRQVLVDNGFDGLEEEPWKDVDRHWMRSRLKRLETPLPEAASRDDEQVVSRAQNNNGKIECPLSEDGHRLFFCPTPDDQGSITCIDDHDLCDRKRNCFNGEDEDETVCMFHRMTLNYIRVLMGAIYGLTRSVV